jgi:chorismate mutase/prephenate dehydratase
MECFQAIKSGWSLFEGEEMKVAFLGPVTSFSHDAALKAFPDADLVELNSIQGVFSAVEEDSTDLGVVPFENSTEGSVTTSLDLLFSKNLFIGGEIFVDVIHCLMAKPGGKIKRIYSHSQAFAQCYKWLNKNYPKVDLVGSASTAGAAESASKENGSAAIGSKRAAEKFGLNVLAENIQDLHFNKTRFIVLSKHATVPGNDSKTSIFFAVKDKPGALFDCLKGFRNFDVNLTRLESRPSKKSAWDYVFFVEFQGNTAEENVKKALQELREYTNSVKILGSYSKIGD